MTRHPPARRLLTDRLLLLLGAVLLVVSFLEWQGICADGICVLAANAWHDVGILAGLLLFALVAWEALRAARVVTSAVPGGAERISARLAAAAGALMVFHFFVAGENRRWPAWLGLILALVLIAAAIRAHGARGTETSSPQPT